MDKMFLTVKEAAEVLNVSRPMVYKLAERDDFPKVRLGKIIRIPIAQLNDWIDQNSYHQGK